jgi:hypothetical protein
VAFSGLRPRAAHRLRWVGFGNQNPTPPPTTQNPCLTASLEADGLPLAEPPSSSSQKKDVVDGNSRWRVLDALWTHREMQLRRGARVPETRADPGEPLTPPPPRNADVGDIAVIQDTGDLVLPANVYDVLNVGLRFVRNGSGV